MITETERQEICRRKMELIEVLQDFENAATDASLRLATLQEPEMEDVNVWSACFSSIGTTREFVGNVLMGVAEALARQRHTLRQYERPNPVRAKEE